MRWQLQKGLCYPRGLMFSVFQSKKFTLLQRLRLAIDAFCFLERTITLALHLHRNVSRPRMTRSIRRVQAQRDPAWQMAAIQATVPWNVSLRIFTIASLALFLQLVIRRISPLFPVWQGFEMLF